MSVWGEKEGEGVYGLAGQERRSKVGGKVAHAAGGGGTRGGPLFDAEPSAPALTPQLDPVPVPGPVLAPPPAPAPNAPGHDRSAPVLALAWPAPTPRSTRGPPGVGSVAVETGAGGAGAGGLADEDDGRNAGCGRARGAELSAPPPLVPLVPPLPPPAWPLPVAERGSGAPAAALPKRVEAKESGGGGGRARPIGCKFAFGCLESRPREGGRERSVSVGSPWKCGGQVWVGPLG